ncbi:tachykinin-like peptides receptor 86C [Halyomorpha halys]|uniref:tachykinin-like peptides receptor 86C n=1 Tax=Halyomorpha halys TaxID=286706 RepID=UPI0006D4F2AA|nr:tachykinin-like peptides receptor 86C [Halyomorpha halys]
MTKSSAMLGIAVIWATSLLIGLPCLIFSTTLTHRSSGQTACIMEWPDGLPMTSMMDYLYNLLLFLFTYILPMVAMVCCYTAMGKELWGSRSIGELTQRQIDSIKSKRKVVKMFILIVIVFAVCWLPYHLYFIYTHHRKDVVYTKYVQHIYLGFYWLAMANAMMNPAIYYFMNPRFREYFRKAICDWDCCKRKKRTIKLERGETPPIRRFSHSYSRSGGSKSIVLPMKCLDLLAGKVATI